MKILVFLCVFALNDFAFKDNRFGHVSSTCPALYASTWLSVKIDVKNGDTKIHVPIAKHLYL